jgi:putative ABC transport system permease protein
MPILAVRVALWLIGRIVPAHTRQRWIEEWRAELEHGPRTMLLGALPDAWALRRLPPEGGRFKTPMWPPSGGSGSWRTDAKQTLRSLARSPWHVLIVSVCLGIGIAVTVTTFSILAAVISGDLPGVSDRSRLMKIVLTVDEGRGPAWSGASLNDYMFLRDGTTHLPAIAAEGAWQFAVNTPQTGPIAVEGQFVSGNYFNVLGTQPARGRLLAPSDDRPGAPIAVVISHAFWTARLGAADDVVGSTIQVGGLDVLVAGVAPEYFSGMDFGSLGEPPGARYKLYVPLSSSRTLARALAENEPFLNLVGRGAAGISTDVLAAELRPVAAAIAVANPRVRKNAAFLVLNGGATAGDTIAVVAAIVALMMAAPLTVLAIGCANVANLQLARASLRRRELAVRLSLGASRAQLIRLLTMESMFLALTACAAGALGTYVLLEIAALVVPFHVTIDWPVGAFCVAIAGLVVFATGVIPAWLTTRARVGISMIASSRSAAASVSRLRRALVVAQIAMSLLLLLTAALFTRSLGVLAGRVPAAAREMVVAEIRFDTLGYDQPQRAAFLEALTNRLSADGRVQVVGSSSVAPLRRGGRRFWLPGDDARRLRSAAGGEVTAEWFAAAGVHLQRGRTFTAEDVRVGNAAVVDQAFVDKYRLDEAVLGTVLRVGGSPDVNDGGPPIVEPGETVSFSLGASRTATPPANVTIVGVVSNALSRPLSPAPQASVYMPLREIPDYLAVYVRTKHANEMRGQIRDTMTAIDPDLPAIEITTIADRFDADAGDIRLLARTASGLGLSALLLALAGVYSVVAFLVSLRTQEFGIRLAIGARPGDIVNMVVRQSSRLVIVGLLAGVLLGAPVLILIGKAFPYASAFDPIALFAPAVGLALTALLAAAIPARRAARVDPCSALRSE